MAAQYGTVTFLFSGETLSKDVYCDDTNGNPVRWDGGSGASATSDTGFVMPAAGKLIDICLAAAPAVTKLQVSRDNTPTGNMLRCAVELITTYRRPPKSISFQQGQKVAITQVT